MALDKDPHLLRLPRAVIAALCVFLTVDGLDAMRRQIPDTWEIHSSDFDAYYWAGKRIREGKIAELYSTEGQDERGQRVQVKDFKNIPLVGVAFIPYSRQWYPHAWRRWWVTSLVGSLLGFIAACWWVKSWTRAWVLAWAIMFWAAAHYYPVTRAFRLGQTSQIVATLIFFAYLALCARKGALAGFLLGMAAILKIPATLFGVFLLLSRRWHAAAAFFTTIAIAAGLSVLGFGLDIHRVWYREVIDQNLGTVFTAMNNQSLLAQLMRLGSQLELEVVNYQPHPLPGWIAAVQWATLAVVAIYWLKRRRAIPPRSLLDLELALSISLMPVVFPVFWFHYFLFTLVAMLFLSRVIIEDLREHQALLGGLLAAAYFLIAIFPIEGARSLLEQGYDWKTEILLGRSLYGSVLLVICCLLAAWVVARHRVPETKVGLEPHEVRESNW